MEIAFYIAAIVAVLATLRVIMHTNAVRALLYLVVSLLAVAVAFFTLGAPFAAALEVIVYAGAIMVLFVFVVMMLNLNIESIDQERRWLQSVSWVGPAIMAVILLAVMIAMLWGGDVARTVSGDPLYAKAVGMALFGPYVLIVELASFLLLAALVVAAHVGRNDVEHRSVPQEQKARAKRGN
ncbi:MAG: NADH-quinone oxidoreductase subunit J [Salinisphaera sp.]|nr:NADH-quinone oxidoreductase subunit J [Salinisphaera sp.]